MRRIVIIIFSVLAVLIILYSVINLWDAKLNPNAYTSADLPDASFDRSNGFYILWGLAESADVDVQSEEYTLKIRQLFDPEFENDDYMDPFDQKKYVRKFKAYGGAIDELSLPNSFDKGWITVLSSQADKIKKARQEAAVPLGRYQQLINTPKFEEFTLPRFSAPIPNVLAWVKVARLYLADCGSSAVNGKWEESVVNIINHMDFVKKAAASVKTLILNAVAKSLLRSSLQALVGILNHPECPESVYPLVLSRMPPLKYEEYGSRNSLIFECLSCFAMVEHLHDADAFNHAKLKFPKFLPVALLLQKNRTRNYFYEFYSRMIAFDMQEPFRWTADPVEENYTAQEKRAGTFRWLRNPVGKILFRIAVPNVSQLIVSSYRIRTYYDMTRILAELHMNYSTERNVLDILKELDSYETYDPCSGKPYAWNKKKGILYSIGTDRVDNEGADNFFTGTDTDFAIPVVLKTKTAK